jgi:hypothetical protein
MESKYQVSNEFAIILQKYASSLALDARHIEARDFQTRISPNQNPFISLEEFNEYIDELLRQTKDSYLGLNIGKYASRFLGINLISYIMMNCSDFRLALLKLADYHHLAMNFVDITLKEEEKFAYYSWNVKSPEINVNYHLVDAIFTSLAYLFRQLTENKV